MKARSPQLGRNLRSNKRTSRSTQKPPVKASMTRSPVKASPKKIPATKSPIRKTPAKISAQKSPKITPTAKVGSADTVQKTPRKSTGRSKVPTPKKARISSEEDIPRKLTPLYFGEEGGAAVQAVVDEWISFYQQDNQAAMADLVQYFVQACGCKGSVTRSMLEMGDTVAAIRTLTEKFSEDSNIYPMIGSGPTYKKFKSGLVQFIKVLVQQCQHSIIYDEVLMDTCLGWLITLSDSQVRAFRHTSTFSAVKFLSSLIDVATRVHKELDNNQKQLEAEKSKTVAKRSRERVDVLQEKKAELDQQISDLRDMMNRIFSGVFVHRYRDIRPEIRALCIEELGSWMCNYSDYFLAHEYIKYTGWTLHDKVGFVRLKAISSLEKLYEKEDFVPKLELFTNRFKDRIVGMCIDKEDDVGLVACRICTLLYRYGALEDEDCQSIQQLVFSDQTKVAHAAGLFVAQILFFEEEESENNEVVVKQAEVHTSLLRLVEFLLKSEVHSHATYLVDSLWEHSTVLTEFGTMCSLLLDTKNNTALVDAEETALIDITVCCIKQAATGQGARDKTSRQFKHPSVKDKRKQYKSELSNVFVSTLPPLLEKFGTDSRKLSMLVEIPQYMDLVVFEETRLSKHVDNLLKQLMEIVQKFSDTELLGNCSKTLYVLMDSERSFCNQVTAMRNQIVDDFLNRLKNAARSPVIHEWNLEDPRAFGLQNSLKKLQAFLKYHNLSEWDFYDEVVYVVSEGTKTHISDEAIIAATNSCALSLVYSLTEIDQHNPDKAELRSLKKRLTSFMSLLWETFSMGSPNVQHESFLVLSDLLVTFAKQLSISAPLLKPLVVHADKDLQIKCRDFVVHHVFSGLDQTLNQSRDEPVIDEESVASKRICLAALCKLIAFGLFDMQMFAPIMTFINKTNSSFLDIIKLTASKIRETSQNMFCKTLLLSLQQVYDDLMQLFDGQIPSQSVEFVALKDLAKKYALMIGVDNTKDLVRQSCLTIHRDGIKYALSTTPSDFDKRTVPSTQIPAYLSFFEVLNEFTPRLTQVDRTGKHGILPYLQEKLKGYPSASDPGWNPLALYLNSLKSSRTTAAALTEATEAGAERVQPSLDTTLNPPKTTGRKRETELPVSQSTPSISSDAGSLAGKRTTLMRTLKRKAYDPNQSPTVSDSSSCSQTPIQDTTSEDDFTNAPGMSQSSWLTSHTRGSKRARLSYSTRGKPAMPTLLEELGGDTHENDNNQISMFSSPENTSAADQRRITELASIPDEIFAASEVSDVGTSLTDR